MREQTLFTIGQVARMIEKKPYQIVYAISAGHLAEPKTRLGNRRAFTNEEVESIAEHFGMGVNYE